MHIESINSVYIHDLLMQSFPDLIAVDVKICNKILELTVKGKSAFECHRAIAMHLYKLELRRVFTIDMMIRPDQFMAMDMMLTVFNIDTLELQSKWSSNELKNLYNILNKNMPRVLKMDFVKVTDMQFNVLDLTIRTSQLLKAAHINFMNAQELRLNIMIDTPNNASEIMSFISNVNMVHKLTHLEFFYYDRIEYSPYSITLYGLNNLIHLRCSVPHLISYRCLLDMCKTLKSLQYKMPQAIHKKLLECNPNLTC